MTTIDRKRRPVARRARAGAARPSAGAATRAKEPDLEQPRKGGGARFVLRLYVTGTTPASARAIERVQRICDEHLQGRYDLEVIDIYQLPALAKHDQIIATPTLIRVLPVPLRRFIGDLSKIENVLFGMDLRTRP